MSSSSLDTLVTPRLKAYARSAPSLFQLADLAPPRRTAPFDQEPGYHVPADVWLYGNARLLSGKVAFIREACGPPDQDPAELDEIEQMAEKLVLDGHILVCGIHSPAQQRVALVPLRWGAPRIIVFSGGFEHHLGAELKDEPFRAARLWRYQWDKGTDLAVSRRAPGKLPTFAQHNPSVDRMIAKLAESDWPGLRWIVDSNLRILA